MRAVYNDDKTKICKSCENSDKIQKIIFFPGNKINGSLCLKNHASFIPIIKLLMRNK